MNLFTNYKQVNKNTQTNATSINTKQNANNDVYIYRAPEKAKHKLSGN